LADAVVWHGVAGLPCFAKPYYYYRACARLVTLCMGTGAYAV